MKLRFLDEFWDSGGLGVGVQGFGVAQALSSVQGFLVSKSTTDLKFFKRKRRTSRLFGKVKDTLPRNDQ